MLGWLAAVFSCGSPASATFPGRNGVIAFAGQDGLQTINADGTHERTLIHAQIGGVSWSPDGRSFVYAYRPLSRTARLGVYVARADGSHRTRITNGNFPCLLNGERIAFLHRGIKLIRTDGSHRRTVLRDRRSSRIRAISCSPDGHWIAYARFAGDSDSTPISLVRPNGSDNHKIAVFGEAGVPDWSPDGTRLAIVTTGRGVVEMNADGSDQQTIISPAVQVGSVTYSPDGRFIAFNAPASSPPYASLNIFDRKSGATSRVLLGFAGGPTWQPLP